ncbi:MAG: hypothetical protein ACREM2_09230 [Vulcanimicrobiaceae bacterium]
MGTSKNAGKTVVAQALLEVLAREGARPGLASSGRDGEALDALEGTPKPRFRLHPETFVATAGALVPRSPALEIVERTDETSALGPIVIGRVRALGTLEIAGPPQAAALRRIVRRLGTLGARPVVIDGALDRLAALAGGDDAIVVAAGAASAPTLGEALDRIEALVARLRLAAFDPARAFLRIEGALTLSAASAFARADETRQIVVRDPTRIALGGRPFLALARTLDLRCERTLHPVACTVAPLGPNRAFDARAFLRGVAERTDLPTFDLYAGSAA